MNSRNLIVAFVTVSIAALIVSCLAVFSVARTYSASLALSEAAESISLPESTVIPRAESTQASAAEAPEEGSETENDETSSTVTEADEESETDISETVSVTEFTEDIPEFTLCFADGRLVITDTTGERIYERIADASDLHPKDLEALLTGISFPDLGSAMSAVYDLIS